LMLTEHCDNVAFKYSCLVYMQIRHFERSVALFGNENYDFFFVTRKHSVVSTLCEQGSG
jgi:hypothetical protein